LRYVIYFQALCDAVRPSLLPADGHPNYIVSDKKVHMAVWFLSNQDVYRSVANLFGMPSKCTAHYCVLQACNAIVDMLRSTYIRCPDTKEYSTISSGFEQSYGFPNVIGCIDGTHIPIKAPARDRDSFINRKGFPSVNVLAVCDDQMKFIDVFAERAGSVHDARVLRVSPLGTRLEQGQLGDPAYHILGDSAYPLLPQLLVPYRDNGHLTAIQTKFNFIPSETRSRIERAFARLKGKFRHLRGLDCTCIGNALVLIEAAFVLHNFILVHEGDVDDDDKESDRCDEGKPGTHHAETHSSHDLTSVNAVRAVAVAKRDSIVALLQ